MRHLSSLASTVVAVVLTACGDDDPTPAELAERGYASELDYNDATCACGVESGLPMSDCFTEADITPAERMEVIRFYECIASALERLTGSTDSFECGLAAEMAVSDCIRAADCSMEDPVAVDDRCFEASEPADQACLDASGLTTSQIDQIIDDCDPPDGISEPVPPSGA